jgi:3',5'-cyclic AMP phosphodiesterase CpdA
MRIAHISDLHIDNNNGTYNFEKARIALEYIADTGYDHLIITGDITHNADRESFELARRLLRKFNMLKRNKLSLVIGNHDIFGGVHFAKDIIQFPGRCEKTDYKKKISEFYYFFRESFEGTYSPDFINLFPYLKELDEAVIIGMNTIAGYSYSRNPFASNGKVHKKQRYEIEKLLLRSLHTGKRKIILSHHHFHKDNSIKVSIPGSPWNHVEKYTMKLYGKKKLIKLFQRDGVDLVLHGHTHESIEYYIKGIRFMNGGGATLGNEPGKIEVNFIDVSSSGINIHIESVPVQDQKTIVKIYNKTTVTKPVFDIAYDNTCLN